MAFDEDAHHTRMAYWPIEVMLTGAQLWDGRSEDAVKAWPQEHACETMDPGIVWQYLALLGIRAFALDVPVILFGIIWSINRLLIIDGSWLVVHGSCLKAPGSRSWPRNIWRETLGPEGHRGNCFFGHALWALRRKPWGMSLEPWTMNHD